MQKDTWRFCHARAARKHRKQEAYIKFSHWSPSGLAVYAWRPANIDKIVYEVVAHFTRMPTKP